MSQRVRPGVLAHPPLLPTAGAPGRLYFFPRDFHIAALTLCRVLP